MPPPALERLARPNGADLPAVMPQDRGQAVRKTRFPRRMVGAGFQPEQVIARPELQIGGVGGPGTGCKGCAGEFLTPNLNHELASLRPGSAGIGYCHFLGARSRQLESPGNVVLRAGPVADLVLASEHGRMALVRHMVVVLARALLVHGPGIPITSLGQ
jgi:hypothetical protein